MLGGFQEQEREEIKLLYNYLSVVYSMTVGEHSLD